eukprot:SAG31_NODE_43300_length_267_cov_1.529762_1_plen_62_part_10
MMRGPGKANYKMPIIQLLNLVRYARIRIGMPTKFSMCTRLCTVDLHPRWIHTIDLPTQFSIH